MIPDVSPQKSLLIAGLLLLVVLLGYAFLRLFRFVQQLRRDHLSLQRTKDVMSDAAQDLSEVFSTGEMVGAGRIMEQILYSAQRTTGSAAGAIYLAGEDGILQARCITGLFPPMTEVDDYHPAHTRSLTRHTREAVTAVAIAPGEGLIGEVALYGKTVRVADATRDPRLPRFDHPDLAVRSLLAAPMRFQNRVMGVMVVVNPVHRLPFTIEEEETLQILADQASLSIFYANLRESLEEKQRLDQEMKVAQRIQDSLQARDLPTVPGVEIAAFTDAAMEVGGDYVDVFHVDADRVGMVVGDVSGKGVGGAIFMAILRTMMRAKAVGVSRPSEVLRQVNRMLLEDMRHERFVTLVYMVLDHRRRELRVSRAGHDPLLFRRAGQAGFSPLGSEGPGLGLLDGEVYDGVVPEDVIPLDTGDELVAYTDGVVEALDDSGHEWGHERFQQALAAGAASATTLQGCLDEVKQHLLRFVGDMAQYDDITLLGVRMGAPVQRPSGGSVHA